jgi:DNA-binding phage protein
MLEMSDEDRDKLPSFTLKLGSRLAEVAKRLGGQAKAAEVMGVSLSQFKRYISGENQPTFEAIAKLISGSDVRLSWFMYGVEPMRYGAEEQRVQIDEELNARVVDGISKLYKSEGIGLSAMDLGRIAAKVYSDLANDVEPDERLAALKGVLSQLRRRLREQPAGGAPQDKRSA